MNADKFVESIKFAGELVKNGEKPPVWVNRILDIVETKVKSTAVKKTQEFLSRIENA